jgi:Ca2+-binding RTX toxin-like protein
MRRAKLAGLQRLEPRQLLAAYTWPSGSATNANADTIQVVAATVNGVSGIQVIQSNNGANTQWYPNCTQLTIYLGDGADNMLSGGHTVPLEVWGGLGNDTITSGYGNDTLYGEGGADSADGQYGNDYIEGSSGADYLRGGQDADTILGGGDNDLILGTDADLNGDPNNYLSDDDVLVGGDGNDTIRGQYGTDDITGSTGADVMTLGYNGGIIQGGAGNDTLYGGAGVDNLIGNEGDDVFYTRDFVKDFQIRGGPDYDRLVEWDDPIDTQLGTDSSGRPRFEIDVFGPP